MQIQKGYRKRAGYQHQRRETWNNLIMTMWGKNGRDRKY